MGAIGLNPIRLDRIGLDPIRINAIKLGVPGASGTERPYIDPEVLASLKAVCICYGKSNDDPDRAIVKNLVDPDNPFVISNAAFKLNSGFGEYSFDFERWGLTKPPTTCIKKNDSFNITYVGNPVSKWLSIVESSNTSDSSIDLFFKVEITGLEDDMEAAFVTADMQRVLLTNGINVVNITIKSKKWYGFNFIRNDGTALGNCNIVVRQIPEFQGAFVTDGIDDLITSTKTVQEMGVTDEVTVVSMIHQITLNPTYNVGTTNYLENLDNGKHIRSDVYYAGKTGIYGYTASLINNTASDIKNILGDKADYSTQKNEPSQTLHNSKFSVVGRARNLTEPSSVAWYWTIIANKVLTTDQINQVIAYYNLDRCVEPTVLYDVKRQGLSNDTPDSDWYLKDFSKNGFDMSLFNFAKDGDSGIGKYNYPNWKITANKAGKYRNIRIYQTLNGTYTAEFKGVTELYNRVGIGLEISSKNRYVQIKEDGIYSVDPVDDATELQVRFGDYTDTELYDCDITITQIPSHAGGLCLDGINDFGKVTGMPVYKDYTFIADRYINNNVGSVASKSVDSNQYGAFIFEIGRANYSFNVNLTVATNLNKDRTISYLSKYSYNGENVNVGNEEDSNSLWIGAIRDNDTRFSNMAIYSLMSFPYSMSEFLIERQLKKHKLGTLYPDMVEFRPIVKSNSEYQVVDYYIDTLPAVVGNYYPINSKLRIAVTTKGAADEVTSLTVNGVSLGTPSVNGNRFTFNGTLSDKSPQKINITIYQPPEYLTMLSNSTLISNETLIKNE